MPRNAAGCHRLANFSRKAPELNGGTSCRSWKRSYKKLTYCRGIQGWSVWVGSGEWDCKGSRTPSCSNRGQCGISLQGALSSKIGLEIPLHSDACCLLFSFKGQLKAGLPACILTINPLPAGLYKIYPRYSGQQNWRLKSEIPSAQSPTRRWGFGGKTRKVLSRCS